MISRNHVCECSSRTGILKILIIALVVLAGVSQASGDAATTLSEQAKTPGMAEKWGIEVVAVRTAAAGNMIDFRYRILNAEKASTLFNRKTKPYLIHQKSGKVLGVPVTAKLGPLRSSNKPQQGRIYWMFFGNRGKLVHKRDKVTVVIGGFRAENLMVQ